MATTFSAATEKLYKMIFATEQYPISRIRGFLVYSFSTDYREHTIDVLDFNMNLDVSELSADLGKYIRAARKSGKNAAYCVFVGDHYYALSVQPLTNGEYAYALYDMSARTVEHPVVKRILEVIRRGGSPRGEVKYIPLGWSCDMKLFPASINTSGLMSAHILGTIRDIPPDRQRSSVPEVLSQEKLKMYIVVSFLCSNYDIATPEILEFACYHFRVQESGRRHSNIRKLLQARVIGLNTMKRFFERVANSVQGEEDKRVFAEKMQKCYTQSLEAKLAIDKVDCSAVAAASPTRQFYYC